MNESSPVRATPESSLSREENRKGQTISRACVLLVLGFSLWIFSFPLRHPDLQLGAAQDDFYYYLKVAQNIASGHGSTFDGTTLTNGYHPLYMLLLVAVSHVATQLRNVGQFLWLFDVACAVSTFWLMRRFFLRRTTNIWLANALALIPQPLFMQLFCEQMEVNLTVPLALTFLTLADVSPDEYTAARAAAIGLAASLTILSRLDSAFLVLLFCLAILLVREYRARLTLKMIAAFAASSGLPLALYFAVNHKIFHRFMPISGASKQMKNSWSPSPLALQSLHSSMGAFAAIALAAVVYYAWNIRREKDLRDRILCPACLLFPFLHLGVLIEMSDWRFWGWYTYSLRLSLLAVMLLVLWSARKFDATIWMRRAAPALVVLGAISLALTRYHLDGMMLAIAQEATYLHDFQNTHPGRYAMGDRAGMFSYLSQYPVLQTEGLMMDDAYLDHIRRQDNLLQVLQQYKVDYYVGFRRGPAAACFSAVEPVQAGQMAPHMRSEFCAPPVAASTDKYGVILVYPIAKPAQ